MAEESNTLDLTTEEDVVNVEQSEQPEEEQPEEEEEEEKEQQQQPEETEEEQAVDEEADSGCAGALSKVTADCQLSYKQINDKVKSGEVEEAAGKEQIAVAARQCVAKTMLATSNCVDKVQRRRLMSLAK